MVQWLLFHSQFDVIYQYIPNYLSAMQQIVDAAFVGTQGGLGRTLICFAAKRQLFLKSTQWAGHCVAQVGLLTLLYSVDFLQTWISVLKKAVFFHITRVYIICSGLCPGISATNAPHLSKFLCTSGSNIWVKVEGPGV